LVHNRLHWREVKMSELRNRKGSSEVAGEEKKPVVNIEKYMPEEAKRVQKLIHEASKSAPPWLVPYVQKLEPVLALVAWAIGKLIPIYIWLWDKVELFLSICPPSLLESIIGLVMCFFGGFFPTLIAAVESWNMSGGSAARESLQYCYEEFKHVRSVNEQDDKKDDDNDGIADVKQISGKELFQRKGHLVLTAIDPNKFTDAICGVYTGWIGVVACLKIEFAKTIALGAAIGDTLRKPAGYVAVPILTHLLPADYHKWIDVIISYTIKSIAITIAWTIQRVISAFHSAIRGGLMFARGLIKYLNEKGYLPVDNDSYADEVLGFATAAAGFYVQFSLRFSLPWILSILLWPLTWSEWYIVWTISE